MVGEAQEHEVHVGAIGAVMIDMSDLPLFDGRVLVQPKTQCAAMPRPCQNVCLGFGARRFALLGRHSKVSSHVYALRVSPAVPDRPPAAAIAGSTASYRGQRSPGID